MRNFLRSVSLALILPAAAVAQTLPQPQSFQPYEGQPGKDVVWVPTPAALVEKMLDMIRLTPRDYIIDLGSGDGRNIIAAAKRGARGHGVEYDPEMVALSQKKAKEAGVADRAKFIRGDMYEADVSRATALVLFLLPVNLDRMRDKFLKLPPGTRIVNNGYRISGWEEIETGHIGGDCITWCTAYLYLVPAQVAGTWRLPGGEVRFEQDFQALNGFLTRKDGRTIPVQGSVTGDRIRFSAGLDVFIGRIRGGEMSGEASGSLSGPWKASRLRERDG
jgi:SAM-dependent methyltransferase